MNFLKDKVVLITGGCGSFGKPFVKLLLEKTPARAVRVYSRDEHKQVDLEEELWEYRDRLRLFLGDVRDFQKLKMATRGVDYVVHAAAYKCMPKCELDPFEAVKTNVLGSQNVIQASLDNNVGVTLLISTDKAVEPINLYGATKMTAERMFLAANNYRGDRSCRFHVSRYGNVAGTKSSVIPLFLKYKAEGRTLPVVDRATRYWITVKEANEFVLNCLKRSSDTALKGSTFIPSMRSVRIEDIAKAIYPENIKYIVPRDGDKLHETLDGKTYSNQNAYLSVAEIKEFIYGK
jgi:UDP-N-acetylglucosamine 4,6-dehydratase/5-epimerase